MSHSGEDLRIVRGPIWGDEQCELSPPHAAEFIYHLLHADGVDQHYMYTCSEHAHSVWAALDNYRSGYLHRQPRRE